MLVRFGYVAMSVRLEDCSPSKTVTVKNLERIDDLEARINRLRRITEENLINNLRLLYYNAAHQINVFRFTSKIVPLVTHPIAEGWDYTADFRDEFSKIGKYVREHRMRVSSHPDHFTLLNSPKAQVLRASLKDLEYHEKVFLAMGLDDAEMIIHVGGVYDSREQSLDRFRERFRLLPGGIKGRIRLENDDKSFGAAEVLGLCRELDIPMVFDVHHHQCLNHGEDIAEILPQAFDTWGDRLPKIHFSSPRSLDNCRAHADDIDIASFRSFLLQVREVNRDFDVMIEAKNKDAALFNLMEGLADCPWITPAGEAAIEL